MPDRRAVLLLMYDLPNITPEQRRDYYAFRRALVANGFIAVQKSVYVRLLHNTSTALNEVAHVRAFAPREGVVNILRISLAEFKEMRTLVGDPFPMDIFSDDILFL